MLCGCKAQRASPSSVQLSIVWLPLMLAGVRASQAAKGASSRPHHNSSRSEGHDHMLLAWPTAPGRARYSCPLCFSFINTHACMHAHTCTCMYTHAHTYTHVTFFLSCSSFSPHILAITPLAVYVPTSVRHSVCASIPLSHLSPQTSLAVSVETLLSCCFWLLCHYITSFSASLFPPFFVSSFRSFSPLCLPFFPLLVIFLQVLPTTVPPFFLPIFPRTLLLFLSSDPSHHAELEGRRSLSANPNAPFATKQVCWWFCVCLIVCLHCGAACDECVLIFS